ncbi:MAG: helix-turn-helix transcriptional regulator [Defluviitaleaceae bacterium]|nr:helix-turn-helix transcriptional regulator [Defluviitaleaceae bacterium]
MTKERLRIIIGENIRTERIARNISIDELAELLELTSGFVGLIERGQRGTTPNTLFKLADVFGTSIDSFFYRENSSSLSFAEESENGKKVKRKKLKSLISDFSEEEIDFVIRVVKGVRQMNRVRIEDDNDDLVGAPEDDDSDF